VIDAGLPEAWPPEVVQALALVKQGHLVERPPIFYAASPRHGIWELTRETGDPELGEDLLELAEDDRPEYGLITTQTCDLVEERAPDHPWFQVVPVYRLTDVSEEERRLLESHRRSHLVLLAPPTLDEATWVADLRVEVPLEKSWLVGRTPIESFPDEQAYQVLSERLAATRERPALATPVVDTVIRPLANWVRREAGMREAAKVDQLRLAISPSRLHVERASLLVLTNEEPLSVVARVPWDRWWGRTRGRAAESGIDLLANRYESYGTITARDYLNAVPLDFGYLSRGV
jgi:hypothetical protein